MTAPGTPSPTQVRHPWRATVRTILAAVVGLATLLPYVLTDTNVGTGVAVTQALAIAGVVTRIMAAPGMNEWLTSVGLGPTPPK